MPAPTSIVDLSTTAASNYPAGSDLPSVIDDAIRALSSVVKYDAVKGSDIASASTITIPAQGKYFIVTGTTTITAISNTNAFDGREVTLKFSGALTLTHSAGLLLPGAVNITTVAGSVAKVVYESTGVWRCTNYENNSTLQLWKASADIASAATVDLTAATGNTTRITGTTGTSAFTMTAGQWHMCIADAAWPLTYHATTNKLNTGGGNYTCAAGDRLLLHKDNSNIIQGTIIPASGQAVVGGAASIPLSIIDAAGDLIVGTAADTAGRLAMGTALQQLRVNAGATALEFATISSSGGLLACTAYTANNTWNKSTNNPTKIVVMAVGGGGAGGGSVSTAGSISCGFGGKAGAVNWIYTGSPAASYSITIGAGGTGVSGGTGNTGSSTTVGALLTALGGRGGSILAPDYVTLGVLKGEAGDSCLGQGGAEQTGDGNGNAASANTGAGGGGANTAGSAPSAHSGGAGGSGYVLIWEFA